jgi:hypothetical protein
MVFSHRFGREISSKKRASLDGCQAVAAKAVATYSCPADAGAGAASADVDPLVRRGYAPGNSHAPLLPSGTSA